MRKIIDIHSHPIVQNPAVKQGWPVDSWSEELLLKFMEENGIYTTVLSSQIPNSLTSLEQVKEFARRINETQSERKKKYPGKIEFAAVAPFMDVHSAIDEIAYAYDHLGACAIKVSSNVKGKYLGNEEFEPIYDELDRRNAVLLLHPTTPAVFPSNHATGKLLPLFEYVVDTTRTVLDIIFSGVLKHHPNIKFVVPHCGSFLPALHDRLNGGTATLAEYGWHEQIDMGEALTHLWYDIACDCMPTLLKQLMTIVPADHILFGSDFPAVHAKDVQKKIRDMEEAEFLQPHLNAILHENAQKLLNIKY